MTSDQKAAYRAKYNRQQSIHDMRFTDVAEDVNTILDSLPESPRTQLLRTKYDRRKGDHGIMFWLAADDVQALLDDVSPVDPTGDAPTDEHAT